MENRRRDGWKQQQSIGEPKRERLGAAGSRLVCVCLLRGTVLVVMVTTVGDKEGGRVSKKVKTDSRLAAGCHRVRRLPDHRLSF